MNQFIAVCLILSLFGCSSKPKNTQENAAVSNKVEAFSLEGSSDHESAGGLRTVNFALDSSSLDATAKKRLQENAGLLKNHPNVSIQIEGHCDERGGRQYNLALGEQRAKAVKIYLFSLGITNRRMDTISYGNERPLSNNRSEAALARNRRGNFVITGN